jgi:NADPH:quinone reductase-like Zn-dependent oxidoreductase
MSKRMRAVRFDHYGPVDVLHVQDVEAPEPGEGEILVDVIATSINPGEIMLREGMFHTRAPAKFPSGQGSDFAGRVAALGAGVRGQNPGDPVIGWTDNRAAQAEQVVVPVDQVIPKPAGVPWDQAACLYVAGCTAYGMVDALAPEPNETVVVTAAAGGVGSIAVQLLRHHGVNVLGIAGPGNDEWLTSIGVRPVNHGAGLPQRLRDAAPNGIDGMLDCYGHGYVRTAITLGVPTRRIVTIIDFDAATQAGAQVVFGSSVASPEMLAELARLIDANELTIPVAATYPLEDVQAAYTQLAQRHTRGKIVLRTTTELPPAPGAPLRLTQGRTPADGEKSTTLYARGLTSHASLNVPKRPGRLPWSHQTAAALGRPSVDDQSPTA